MATQIDRPAVLATSAFLGFVNVTAMLLAASWAERRQADAARDALLAEVLRQRDELARLSAEAAVQQAFLTATFDQLPAAAVTVAPDSTILSMNAAAREWFAGYNVVVGWPLQADVNWATYAPGGERVPDEACPLVRTLVEGVVVHDAELRYMLEGRPGEGVDLTVNVAPVRGPGGENLGAVALYQDLTAVRLGERRLRDSEERLRFVMRWARLTAWDADFAAGTLQSSDDLAGWFDLPDAKSIDTSDSLLAIVHSGDRDALFNVKQTALAGGEPNFEARFRVPHPDGATRYYLARGRVLPDVSGRPSPRYTGVFIDITKEKADEQRLAAAGVGRRPRP